MYNNRANHFHLTAEVNQVKIIGTLTTDTHTLASGTKALSVKTRDSPVK